MYFSFIHTADIHLDSPFKGLIHLPKHIREQVAKSTESAFEDLIEYAIAQRVDFLIIAGDIYDQVNRSVRAQLFVQSCLRRLDQVGIKVYMVHGNHDPLQTESKIVELPENTVLFQVDQVQTHTYQKEGIDLAQIHGISYATKKEDRRLASQFKVIHNALFNIGVLHTQVEGQAEHDPYAPSSKQELLAQEIDYWALGHVHLRQVLHERPYIIYPGNLQGRHVKESGLKGFYHVQVGPQKEVTLNFKPVQQIVWLDVEIHVEKDHTLSAIIDKIHHSIEGLIQEYSCSIMLQIKLQGNSGLYRQLLDVNTRLDMQEAINQQWAKRYDSRFLWVHRIQYAGSPIVNLESLRNQDSLLGESIRGLEEWRQGEAVPSEVKEALAELFNHHRARKYLNQLEDGEWEQYLNQIEQQLHLFGAEDDEYEN